MKEKIMKYKMLFETETKGINSMVQNIKSFTGAISGATAGLIKLTDLTDKYITSQQVLNHTFGEGTKELNKYVSTLSDMIGIGKTGISQAISLFGQMGTSLGMNTELAGEFAEKLTDLSARISIMYNQDFTRSSKAILGAMKGEVRTLASITGIVVKSGAQQNLLDRLGINAKVSDLNSVNQALLKYLIVSKAVMEDDKQMAIYAESVAYQKKVLTAQVQRLAQAFGNMLYPALQAILPLINGVMMALANLMNFFAGLFGYNDKMTNKISTTANDIMNLGNSIEKAGKKAKLGLRGFDKLNNITTPTTSGSGGIMDDKINDKLLQQMREMDDKMLNIRMKATEISENIMKWLGFGKDLEGNWKFVGVTFGTILGALVGAGGIVWATSKVIKTIKGVKGIFSGLGKLDKVGELFGGTSKVVGKAGELKLPSFKTVIKGLGEFTLVLTTLVGVVVGIGALTKVDGFTELTSSGINELVKLFTGLGKIMIPLVAFNAMVTVMGTTGWAPFIGDLAFVTGIIAVGGIVTALGAIFKEQTTKDLISGGVETLITIFKGLEQIMVPLIAFNAMVTVMGATGFAPFIGEGAFVVGIAALTEVVIALGALAQSDGAKTLISGGIDLLVELGNGLGRFFGSIVGGIGEGLTASLPNIGTNLSAFAENAKPFFDITSNFSSDNALGVKYLAEALLALSATELMNNLNGTNLKGFINNLMGNNTDSLFVKFGKQLADFAPYFVKYSKEVSGIKGDVVLNSVKSADALVELARKLPNSGGVKDWITGNNDIDKWGKKLPVFGQKLKEYSQAVSGLDTDVVQKSIDCANSIKELAKSIPNTGGLVTLFTGDNDIEYFGAKVASFGWKFQEYSNACKYTNIDAINRVSSKIREYIDMARTIKNEGISNAIEDFAKSLKRSSNPFNEFFSKTNGTNIGKSFGNGIASGIATALKNYKYPSVKLTEPGLFGGTKTVKSFGIQVRASGGYVDSGDMFIARENGLPEMVGRIGSHTAVANNDQIVDAVASGVARANAMTKQNTKVEIVAQSNDAGLLDFITFKKKEQNRQYGF